MQDDVLQNALDYLLLVKSKLEAQKLTLDNQLNGINHAIEALGGDQKFQDNSGIVGKTINIELNQVNDDTLKYNKDGFLTDKFLYVLSREKRFLHFREAAECIIEIENIVGDKVALVKDLASKISSATTFLKKKGTIVKIRPTNKNQDTFWGRPEWLDENGKILEGYYYDKKRLYSNKTTTHRI